MAHYVFLSNWTEQGIKNVKDAVARVDTFRKEVDQAGGKLIIHLHTMGIHDAVSVVELPSDEVANLIAIRAGMRGAIRTVTLKGWTAPEFAELTKKL